MRKAEEAKVARIMEQNEKNREAAEKRKMAREKKYEQQKEAELSARKRSDAAYAELRAANEAEMKMKKVSQELPMNRTTIGLATASRCQPWGMTHPVSLLLCCTGCAVDPLSFDGHLPTFSLRWSGLQQNSLRSAAHATARRRRIGFS